MMRRKPRLQSTYANPYGRAYQPTAAHVVEDITPRRRPVTFSAYLITLQRTPERTASALSQLADLGIPTTVVWAADCQCPQTLSCMPVDRSSQRQAGEHALCESWRRALAQFVRGGADWGLIFEDDAEAERGGVLEAVSGLPQGTDIVLLHAHHRPEPDWLGVRCGPFRRCSRPGWQSHAVAVSQSGARKLLAALSVIDLPIDEVFRILPDASIWQCERDGFYRQTFWSSSLVRAQSVPADRIPRRLHQIWIGGPMPSEFAAYACRWRQLHPGWEYRLWDDAALAAEFPDRNPSQWGTTMAAQADVWRLLILERFGGLYVDADFEPFRPFDRLVSAGSFAGAWIGEQSSDGRGQQAANGLLACAPGHPWIKECVRLALDGCARGLPILEAAGPEMLTRVLRPFCGTFAKPLTDGDSVVGHAYGETGLVMLAAQTVFPYLWFQPRPSSYPATAWAAHHWARSWWTAQDWGASGEP